MPRKVNKKVSPKRKERKTSPKRRGRPRKTSPRRKTSPKRRRLNPPSAAAKEAAAKRKARKEAKKEDERQREENYRIYGRRETHAEMIPWFDERQRSRNLASYGVRETNEEARLRRRETGFLNLADERAHEMDQNQKIYGHYITDAEMKIVKRSQKDHSLIKYLRIREIQQILDEAKKSSPPTQYRYLRDPRLVAEDRLKEKERVRKVNEKNLEKDRGNYL